MKRSAEILILIAILAVATWLRVRGLDWGLPHPYHPDEGSILFHALAFGTGDLNPHWFRWPSLLMYFMFGVYGAFYLIGRLAGTFGTPADLLRSYLTDLSPFWMMGRWVSAIAGVATVWVTYRIGKRAFGAAAGLAGALFLAVVYLHVRDSHYATPDVVTTLLAALSLLLALRACDTARVADLVASGLFAGLAASVKYPGVIAAAGTLAAFAHLVTARRVPVWSLVAAAAACVAGFVVGTPYSVLSTSEFVRDITRQFTMVSSAGVGQGPTSFAAGLIEIFGKSVARGIGYLIFILAVFGAVLPRLGDRTRRGRHARTVIAVYAVAMFLVMMLITVKRSTYLTPSLPALAVLAAAGAEALWRRLARPLAVPAGVPLAVITLVVAGLAMVPSVRFGTALAAVDTRTRAARWVENEIPPGSTVVVEDYGPVLNGSEEQLSALVDLDSTAVDTWKTPKRHLNELRLEIGRSRSPQYVLYEVGHAPSPFGLPDAAEDPDGLISAVDGLGATFVILSSKAAPWRPMDGAEAPDGDGACAFRDWLEENGVMRERFVADVQTPPIDRGDGRSFHSPVIEVFELGGSVAPTGGGSVGGHDASASEGP